MDNPCIGCAKSWHAGRNCGCEFHCGELRSYESSKKEESLGKHGAGSYYGIISCENCGRIKNDDSWIAGSDRTEFLADMATRVRGFDFIKIICPPCYKKRVIKKKSALRWFIYPSVLN